MFTHIPRTGAPLGTSARTHLTRTGTVVSAIALGAGLSLLVPTAATAAVVPTSYAQAQFLSGSLLGGDLANVVALEGAEAYNDGTQDKQTSKDPLHATALDSIDVDVPGGVQLDLGSFLDAGAVNQYAEADKDGKSLAASGAIGDDGAIGVGSVGSGAAGDLDLDLNSLLGENYLGLLTDLKLSLEAVAAQAVGNLDTASGDYTLAGATLSLKSPAISKLTEKVLEALGVVDDDLLSLTGDGGGIAIQLAALVQALNPLLSLGANADVSVEIKTNLQAAVTPLLTGVYGNGAVSFNLQTGAIEIDLETLLGGDLNDLPPNTELISSAVLVPVLQGITGTIEDLIDDILLKVDQTLRQAILDVHVGLDVPVNQLVSNLVCETILKDVVGPIGATVDQVLSGQVGGLIDGVSNGLPIGTVLPGLGLEGLVGGITGGTGGVGGIIGGLFGGGTGGTPAPVVTTVLGQVTEQLCETVQSIGDVLHTGITLDIEGTLAQILAGKPGTASASLIVANLPVTVNIANIVNALGINLAEGLFDTNDGAIADLLAALNLGLLDPAVDGLLGDELLGLDGLGIALDDILSVLVNVQERFVVGSSGLAITQPGSYFTETAVRVSVLTGGLAVLNVAAATVGPNVSRVIDPGCTTNCNPNCPTGQVCPPGTGDPGTPGTPSSSGSLAMTGAGVASLLAVILALLAAGAYLAREGYRRNHPQSL